LKVAFPEAFVFTVEVLDATPFKLPLDTDNVIGTFAVEMFAAEVSRSWTIAGTQQFSLELDKQPSAFWVTAKTFSTNEKTATPAAPLPPLVR
jgi:hypothetical protein